MNAQNQTENLTIHHKVKDYAAWRKGYDDHEKARHAAGVTNGRVFRSAEDPNDVLILRKLMVCRVYSAGTTGLGRRTRK